MGSGSPIVLQEHQILDRGMTFPIDSAYAVKGQVEEWLVYIHGFRDYRGVFVSTYVYKE